MRSTTLPLLAFVLTLGLGCCGYQGPALQLDVQAVAGMNDDTPVAVELVLFFDQELFENAQAMSAAQWFGELGQRFRRQNVPGRRTYDVHRWEWIPGQQAAPAPIPLPGRTDGAVLFADYPTLSEHRQIIEDPDGLFQLELRRGGFLLTSLADAEGPI